MAVETASIADDPETCSPPDKGTTKRGLLAKLGPGLITGASDDDPSGIATYSQVGAQFGNGMLWVMLFSYPLMSVIQEISGRIGRVSGRGIAGNLRKYYHPVILYAVILLVVVANVINIGADLNAMGAAVNLLIGGPILVYAAILALVSLGLEILLPYERYAGLLKWLCAVLFAYVATVFVVHVNWGPALLATVMPSFHWKTSYVTAMVAVLGTTISPYLFFWQAEEEVELERASPVDEPLRRAPKQAASQLHRIRVDTYIGMAFSNLIAFFIILTAASTLHRHHITDIDTAQQAAEALRPIAGNFAFLLFSLGMIGTGMLAIPVLAGSAAYAVGEALHWPVGLNRSVLRARGFYAVLAAATMCGLGINFVHISPIKALFWSAVINGVVAVPVMICMMLMASSEKVMSQFTVSPMSRIIGWFATAVMAAAAIILFATWGK